MTRLTAPSMLANIGGAGVLLWAFGPSTDAGMWLWGCLMIGLTGVALASWWQSRHRARTMASPRALHRTTWHSIALSGLWAVVPLLWFPGATAPQQLLIATLVTGLLSAGAFVLSALPLASLAYVAVYTVSALGGLWSAGHPTFAGVAVLLGLYSTMVAIGALAAWRKSTALLRSRAEALEQEAMLAMLLQDFEQHADEALWETDRHGHLAHLSPRLSGLLEVTERDCRALPWVGLLAGASPDDAAALREAMAQGRPFRGVVLSRRQAGRLRHFALTGKQRLDDAGQPLGWRGVLADVTDKLENERLLHRLALGDSLTGLANRFRLRDVLAEQAVPGSRGGLLSLDLDHFKAINDSLGHSVGDEVLKVVAMRLREAVRPADLVARLGGDEFAVVLPGCGDVESAQALACRLIELLEQPIDVFGRRLRVGASIGVAMWEGDEADVDTLLVRADTALYAAKEAGRGRHALFSAQLGARNQRRLGLEAGLRGAVELGELALHWQPKVDIGTGEIHGAEALLRWHHATLGAIAPAEFIPIAEQTGRIDELGRWALREACRVASGALDGLVVSVNVSALQLRDGQFLGQVSGALAEFGLAPSRLELEITESVFLDDADGALDQLHAMRALGVRMALDDFGTGYSSLAYLRRFPFDTLKIDRAFVHELPTRADARAIVRMIAQLAATLGMRTVCEGVETAQELDIVSAAGCDAIQGYLIAPALPLDDFVALRRGWVARPPHTDAVCGESTPAVGIT